jgi:hypothetical protein
VKRSGSKRISPSASRLCRRSGPTTACERNTRGPANTPRQDSRAQAGSGRPEQSTTCDVRGPCEAFQRDLPCPITLGVRFRSALSGCFTISLSANFESLIASPQLQPAS